MQYTRDDILTLNSSLIAFISTLIIFASFYFCTKWRNQQKETKKLLFVVCIFDSLTAANYFSINKHNGFWCQFQVSLLLYYYLNHLKRLTQI